MSFEEKRRKIIFLGATPPPYMGPSVINEYLLNSELSKVFEVDHIDLSDRRSLENIGKVEMLNILLAIKHYFVLFKKLLTSKGEIIYFSICQTTLGFLRDIPFILLPKCFGKKVVLHFHGGNFHDFYYQSNKFMQWLIASNLRLVDGLILLGPSLKKFFGKFLSANKLYVVPNGVDIFTEKIYRTWQQNRLVRVLFLSNLLEVKGVYDVLLMARKILMRHKNVEFVFAGAWVGSSYKEKCEGLIAREKLAPYVQFIGTVLGNAKKDILKNADIFVLSAHLEGQSLAVLEAMAAGLPVVISDEGCIKDFLEDGIQGFIFKRGDIESFSEKVCSLVKDFHLRKKMGENARKLYELFFTKEHFVKNMVNTFQKV